jgi:N-acetylglucosaminyl-diphospho-decaprenol L-rhamnosyltransferase
VSTAGPNGLPHLSLVIVSYNTASHLSRCLASIGRYPPTRPFEIVVVDNASSDDSAEMVARDFPEVRLVRRPSNDGYGVAVNSAVKVTAGKWLMFLNPDVEVREGSLDQLCDFADRHPRAGVVGPRLELADGRVQASAQHFCSPWRLVFEGSRLHLLLPRKWRGRLLLGTYFDQSETCAVPWISGACHLIPRSVWDDVGPLTEETFCGFDDYDFCYRARSRGYEVWLDADTRMTHHCSVAVRARWNQQEVEQVAIHNTYVVLESHWSWWRIKALQAAELMTYGVEWLRVTSRRRRGEDDAEYQNRLSQRVVLFGRLLVGRQRPIRRFGGTRWVLK